MVKKLPSNYERSKLSGVFNGTDFLYIGIFPAVRRAVNVLMFLRVSKYPLNAILRSANINELAQYTTVAAYVEHTFAGPMLASYYYSYFDTVCYTHL